MKKILLLFIALSCCYSLSEAQLLWKISGNSLKQPSYLFGTHHLIPIQFLDSVPGLFKAFNSCETVVGEMLINTLDATAQIQKAARMPEKMKISDLIKGDDYKLLDNELKSVLKLGLKELAVMNPTLILTLYETEMYKKLTKLTDDKQSDSYFQLVAVEKDKKVIGLETVDQQIAVLFGSGSLQRQADVLLETIKNKNSMLKEFNILNHLYRAGKLDDLLLMTKKSGKVSDMTDEEYRKLVTDRNAAWMAKLPGLMKDSGCFIAVGALHLPGADGLIKLLEKQGYKVTPITPNP